MNEKQLMDLKADIEESKTETATLKGKRSQLLDTLKKDFKCDSLLKAKEKVASLEQEIEDLESDRDDRLDELEKKYL